ncbi:MAG: hypothetical protein ACJ76M_18615 [Solirubrobacteraceae bacterium]
MNVAGYSAARTVGVHDRVPPAARDQPAVDRIGDDAEHHAEHLADRASGQAVGLGAEGQPANGLFGGVGHRDTSPRAV